MSRTDDLLSIGQKIKHRCKSYRAFGVILNRLDSLSGPAVRAGLHVSFDSALAAVEAAVVAAGTCFRTTITGSKLSISSMRKYFLSFKQRRARITVATAFNVDMW
jgi:hypothetical protein